MPIYAYKCATCGHAKDVLQKISDAPLSVCPACGAATFNKQLTAAGFQLKGSGWYATDFKGGAAPAAPAADAPAASGSDKPAEKSADKPADKGADSGAKTEAKSDPTPAAPKPVAPSGSA